MYVHIMVLVSCSTVDAAVQWYCIFHLCLVSTGEPAADVIYNQFQVPLPKVATREVVAIKYWISDYMTEDGTEGTACVALTRFRCNAHGSRVAAFRSVLIRTAYISTASVNCLCYLTVDIV